MNTTTPVDWVPAEQVPLRLWPGGSVRVGGTRVSLDTVIGEHHNGLSPEEIVRAYDCLELADVYAAIAFYLRNRVKVDEYLAEGHRKAEESRAYFEARCPPITRAELMARLKAKEKAHAPAGV